jgi:single-strand DNA-binding protein
MNLGVLTGNLGRDPEMRQHNGDAILNFAIGVQTGTRDKPNTMWVDCTMWGKRAEAVQPYLAKGMRVTVQGPLSMEEYKAKDGTPRTKLKLKVDNLDLPPKSEGSAAPAPRQAAPAAAPASTPAKGGFDDMDDDIPF